MRRGEIWTVSGKPRPVVTVQDDSFDATDSITICAFTTDETDAPLFRLPDEPSERNGLGGGMRDFSKVSPALWQSERFNNLPSDDGRYLYVYLLTNEHQTSAGCYRLPDGYAPSRHRFRSYRNISVTTAHRLPKKGL